MGTVVRVCSRDEIDRPIRQVGVNDRDVGNQEIVSEVAVCVIVLRDAVWEIEVTSHIGQANGLGKNHLDQIDDAVSLECLVCEP